MIEKSKQIEKAQEDYRKELAPAMKIYDDAILPFYMALGEAKENAQIILDKTMIPAWEKLEARIKEIENL